MTCTCNHHAPSLRMLRSSAFNCNLARFYKNLGLSGDGTVDRVLDELYDHRTGRLFGPCGTEIPVDEKSDVFDHAFSQEPRRWMLRYFQKAARPSKNRLDHRCVFGLTVLHLAQQVLECRTQGCCHR